MSALPRLLVATLGILAAGTACGPREDPPPSGVAASSAAARLPDEAQARGLVHVGVSGRPEKPTILEANGSGCALFDLQADGDLDALLGRGVANLEALVSGPGAPLTLFVNDGAGNFQSAPQDLPVDLRSWWTGLACGDLDGDGRSDVVAAGFGALAPLLQTEAGTLARVPDSGLLAQADALVPGAPREPGRAPHWATSLALLDADRDGTLDLYVGRYVAFDPLDPPVEELGGAGDGTLAVPCRWKGLAVFCGPRGLPAQPDALFRGRGDGRFEDASSRWLPSLEPAYTLGVAPFDADQDGDADLYVANDSVPNRLLVNDLADEGRFLERGFAAGVAVNPDGLAEAGMGIAIGDVNRDGRLDLCVTNFSDEPTQLYLGAPRGFLCASYRSGLASATRAHLSWGAHLVDLDGDGGLELFTANGHVYPQADELDTATSYRQPDTLFRFDAEGRAHALELPGSLLAEPAVSRGSAIGDVNGDGAPDLLVTRVDAACALGINRWPQAQRLAIRCLGSGEPGPDGRRTPADGTGARVIVRPLFTELPAEARLVLVEEVYTSRGYQSASTPWLHFGLGEADGFESVVVLWPSGRREELGGGSANRRLWIREGAGIVREEPL